MADKDSEGDAPDYQGEDSDRALPIDAKAPSMPLPNPEDVFRDMLENPAPSPHGSWEPVSPEKLDELLPGFQVIKLLGRGGMGAVYQAIQENLDRPVAIKVLPPSLGGDAEFEARFRREAKAMARLNHPNIIQIHDFGQTPDGHFYFVMEFVDGFDLNDLIKRGHIKPDTALKLAIQICEALQFAHDQGFVHRDIKPANILLTSSGVIKMGDFGLAKLIDPKTGAEIDKMGITMTGYYVGTPNYMAPEQMNGKNQIDHRADIYSLGVMLYEMLTGEIPRGAFGPPSGKSPVDARIDDVVLKAMHEKPDCRYQAAKDFESDVKTIRTSTRGYTTAAREKKQLAKSESKSKIRPAVLVSLLLLVAVAAGISIWKSMDPATAPPASPVVKRAPVQMEIPPALSALKSRGGRLQGWVKNGTHEILQLSKAKDIDDFIELDGHLSAYNSGRESTRWLAKRRDGSPVTNLGNFSRANEIVSLNAHVGVLQTGEIFDCWSDQRKIRSELSDAVDAGCQAGPTQCRLVLRKDGSLYLDGTNWTTPELETIRNRITHLTDVVKIEQGYMASAILRSNGEVIGWSGYDLLETNSPGRKFVDIVASSGMVGALDTQGRVSIWNREGAESLPDDLENGYAIRAYGNLFAIQKEDGSWRAWEVYRPNSPAKPESAQHKIHSIGPAVDILFFAHPKGAQDAVLWLQPGG